MKNKKYDLDHHHHRLFGSERKKKREIFFEYNCNVLYSYCTYRKQRESTDEGK